MAKKSEKSAYNPHWGIRIFIVVLVGVLLAVSVFLFEDRIDSALGFNALSEHTDENGAQSGDSQNQDSQEGSSETGGSAKEDLNVHFVDVGQGDACIVELPDDKTMIIDGGDRDAKDALLDYIKQNIKDDEGNTITYFDYAILTHTDADHCGSLDDVLNVYPARNFYRPNVLSTYSGYTDPDADMLSADCEGKNTKVYMEVLEAAYKSNPTVYINSYLLDPIVPEGISEGEDGYYSLSFYGPNSNSYNDSNNYSPIMVLEYEGEKFMLTGDCEKEGEAEFVEKVNEKVGKFAEFDDDYAVSVIKAGHHGSRTSTGEAFVEAITTPQSVENTLVVISCGEGNSYGHPHQEKLDQFKAQGFKDENILRTDEKGSVLLSVRYDEASGEMRLFYGEGAMQKPPSGSGSAFDIREYLRWRYIALAIFLLIAIIVFIVPVVKKMKINIKVTSKRR